MGSSPDPIDRNRLRYNVLLEPLDDEEFRAVEAKLRRREFLPDDVIIEEETHGDEIYFLVQGRVKICKQARPGGEQLLAVLHPGDCFGELELIAGRPRSARVVALEPVIAYALAGPDFESLLDGSGAFAHRLLQVVSVRARAMNYNFVREWKRGIDRARSELGKLSHLIEAAKRLNSTLDLDRLLDIILEIALQAVDGDRGTVYLLDESKRELWTKIARGLDSEGRVTVRLPVGKGVAGYVAATGDTLTIPDAYVDPRFDPSFDKQTGYRTHSILCMPMRNKDGRIIGVFQLLNKRSGEFTHEDATFIDALSIHASLAIENARLYEQERQKIRIERDLMAAREVQMSLLPKQVPEVPGYDFSGSTIPAFEVAGDLYDFVPLDRGRIAICLGDVSGKGLAASLLMANIQATLRDQSHVTASVAECVRRTNTLLFQSTTSEKFVTLFYGVLDPAHHTFSYCSAGQDPGILLSGRGDVKRLDSGGVILGILEDFPFEEETVPLSSGDVVVLYSDGISEAAGPRSGQFGAAKIESILKSHARQSAVAIQNAILSEVGRHVGDASQADDMTIVVFKRTT